VAKWIAPALSDKAQAVYFRHILVFVARRSGNPLERCTGFEWDEGNTSKNWERHRVTPEEAEDVFFNEPLLVSADVRHSGRERRFYALGQTSVGRQLFVAFTVRGAFIRVISVRDMNSRESEVYAKRQDEAGT
jgi:uncharacterized DUF497 family protein